MWPREGIFIWWDTHTRAQANVQRSVQWPWLWPAAGIVSGIPRRVARRGVDQYVKIESDATIEPPPSSPNSQRSRPHSVHSRLSVSLLNIPPPLRHNRCPVQLRVSRLNRLICHPCVIFFSSSAKQISNSPPELLLFKPTNVPHFFLAEKHLFHGCKNCSPLFNIFLWWFFFYRVTFFCFDLFWQTK